jgi:FkbH-like protein
MRDHSTADRQDDLERAGDAKMAAKAPAEALPLYEAAAAERETPPARLTVKAARAALAAGAPETAAHWCIRTVDVEAGYAEWVAAAAMLRQCPPEAIPARRTGLRVALVATWTTKTFAPLLALAAARSGMQIDVREAEYGQYFNDTLQPGSALLADAPDVVILLPDDRALGLSAQAEPDPAALEAEVARWTSAWDGVRAQSAATLVQLGFARRPGDVFGNFGAGFPGSLAAQVAGLNRALAERANARDIAFVDVDRLAARAGAASWFDDRSWYMAKIPYAPAALCRLAQETAVTLAARFGLSRRCLVLDLDNTLWGGVIGDDGLAGIRLGEGVEGEAYVDFQRALKTLTARGILLAVCSKNDLEVARQPFERHPEMALKLDDIAAFVANWEPKSEGLLRISRELDLGLESLTFFDDNAYEREEVRRRLPDVDVPVLPPDPTRYRAALEAYPYFEPGSFTAADARRGEQYRARAQAKALQDSAGSLDEYQKSLDMVARIGPIDELNMARVVQLINKTNQFNLTTRRRNRAELETFIAAPDTVHFWVRLADRFADHGLIAVVLGTVASDVLEIDTLLMSCRVIGRGVEEVVLRHVADLAAERGAAAVRGVYIPTERNGMVADLYPRLGFAPERTGDRPGETQSFLAKRDDLQHTAHIRVERMA